MIDLLLQVFQSQIRLGFEMGKGRETAPVNQNQHNKKQTDVLNGRTTLGSIHLRIRSLKHLTKRRATTIQ
jgi:hypothetical protein